MSPLLHDIIHCEQREKITKSGIYGDWRGKIMTSAFESAFINHLRENNQCDTWPARRRGMQGEKRGKEDNGLQIAHRRVLKKYRKQWHSYRSVRKKILSDQVKNPEMKRTLRVRNMSLSNRHSWPTFHSEVNGSTLFVKRHSIDTSDLQSASFCKDFPISEIGTELSGNRGNGNSPFNSSNSCGSPEGLSLDQQNIQPVKQLSDPVKLTDQSDQKKCITCSLDIEPNNNADLSDVCSCSKADDTEVTGSPMYKDTNVSNSSEDFIDVVSVDDVEFPGEIDMSNKRGVEELDEKTVPLYINVYERSESPVQYIGSNSSRNAQKPPPISPIKWQQQFMSFLSSKSSTQLEEPETTDVACNNLSSHSHSSRRKRSRKVRNSMCPCCLGLPSHKRRKHHSSDGRHSHHSKKLSREQRHFIRDMVQLVSLRNKIVQLLCALLPECKDQLSDINPDTDGVEKCVDQIIFILKSDDNISFDEDLESSQLHILKSASDDNDLDSVFDVSECPSLIKSPDISQSEHISAYGEETDDEDMPVLDHFMSSDELPTPPRTIDSMSQDRVCDFRTSSVCRDLGCEFDSKLQGKSEGDSGIIPDEEGTMDDKSGDHSVSVQTHSSKSGSDSLIMGEDVESGVCDDQNVCDRAVGVDNVTNSKYLGTKLSTEVGAACQNTALNSHLKCSSDCQSVSGDGKLRKIENLDADFTGAYNSAGIVQEVKSAGHENDQNTGVCETDSENGISNAIDMLSVNSVTSACENAEINSHMQNRSDPFINQKFAFNHSTWKADPNVTQQQDLFLNEDMGHSNPTNDLVDAGIYCSSVYNQVTTDQASCHDIASKTGDHGDLSASTAAPSVVEVYEPEIKVCKKPKICLKAFKKRIQTLLSWLLPELTFENFFKNSDNLEYLLDAIIISNQRQLSVER